MDILNKNGYIIIKDAINLNILNKTKEYIKNDKVNYSEMTDFIQTDIFKIINNKLNDKYDYMKYRVSNNNNSSDAGSFHKDTKEGFTCCKLNTIFTCIMYWDKSMFQLIKGSHNILIMTPDELINYYKQKITINVNPGDLIIFHSNLLHRGIFYKKVPNRRILQIFDIVKKKDYDYYTKNILHIPCKDKCSNLFNNYLQKLNKIKCISELINFLNYINVGRNYGVIFNQKYSNKKYIYLSSEANADRLIKIVKNTFQDNNLYIINPNLNNLNDIPKDYINLYRFYNDYANNIILFILIVILLFITYYLTLLNIT